MRIFDDSIEACIINEIKDGGKTAMQIVAILISKNKKVTKQAIYQVLRKLKKEEVVVVFRKRVTLSQLWLDKMITFFESASSITNKKVREPFLNLTEGDSITYSFKTPYLTDQFWGHAFLLLVATTSANDPVYIYNPHQWFMITRYESELALIKQIESYKKIGIFLIGNQDPIDLYIKKYFSNRNVQYYNKQISLPYNYYMNIFEDYILEVWLDKKLTKEIDDWYKNNKEINTKNTEELTVIVHKSGRNKMRISRNKKRAFRLKKLFAKDFYISKK